MVNIEEIRRAQRADGPATVMAIATANPPNCIEQNTFADFYFRITNSEDKTELKKIFKRTCERSLIKKRYTYLTEELLRENPNICAYTAPSLDARQDMVKERVPKLAKEAASEAIMEWARPISEITHLVFCSSAGIDMPGADYELSKLLELRPSVKRIMLYHSGCYAGGTMLRMAKDIAENNRGARVLVVSCEIFLSYFRGPSETNINGLNVQSAFGDGAAALVVGSEPIPDVEKSLFEIAFTSQTIVPESEGTFHVDLRETGFMFHEFKNISEIIPKNIDNILGEAFEPLGISDWNSIFWVTHPGGRGLLDRIEEKLGLKPEKLQATRDMLSEYGNMGSANVFFTLNEIRKRSEKDGLRTTGQGHEWGVLFGYGAGLTVETVVLHSVFT